MSFFKGTLTLDDNLLISASHKLVQKVINNKIKCDKLIINGTINTFDPDFLGSPLFDEFWMKLGETDVSLELNERAPVGFLNYLQYLTNLSYLSIEQRGIYQEVLQILREKNVALEVLSISEKLIDFTVVELEAYSMIRRLATILYHFKTTLKCLTIECSIPLEKKWSLDLMSALAEFDWKVSSVKMDYEPTPQGFSDWELEKVQLNIETEVNVNKIIVKPLFLREIVKSDTKLSCPSDCTLNHQVFNCRCIKRLSFDSLVRCNNFYQSCFKSFPFIVELKNLPVRDIAVLHHISDHLTHLTDLSILYETSHERIELSWPTWPSFPKITNFAIASSKTSKRDFKGIIKALPNLQKLCITIKYNHHYAKIITKTLKDLEYLSIKCVDSSLTSLSLSLIGSKLKKLKELQANCDEPFSVIENLFKELPNLDVFSDGNVYHVRSLLSFNPNRKQITDLPPELLEKLFLQLTKHEQKICRQVCKRWVIIQTLNSKFYTKLNLRNSYLSCGMEPVEIFSNTNFKYNSITFNGTSFAEDEDLTSFWATIGADVKEMCIQSRHLNIMTAVKSGLRACHFPKLRKLTIDVLPLFYELLDQDIAEWNLLLNQVEHLSINYLFHRIDTKEVQFSMSNVTQLTVDGCMNETTEVFFQRISFPKLMNLIILHVSYESIDLQQIFNTKFNFGQIKTLFIGNYYEWFTHNFDLISENCSSLECLGIGFITKRKNWSKNLNYDVIPKKLFDDLVSLVNLYFVTFKNNTSKKYYRTYQRARNGLTESIKSCHVFDEIESSLNN